MEIVRQLQNDTLNVTFIGSFTFGDHPDFRELLQQMENNNVQKVMLNLRQVDFVDSAALGMLLLALDAAEKHKKNLTLGGPTGQVKKMFDLARFDTLFTIVEDLSDSGAA